MVFRIGVYKNYVFRKVIEIWKQIDGDDINPFDDEFISSTDTLTDWWMSVELKKNEDYIKTLTLKVYSVSPHNAACEQLFSILNWYLEKRRTRLSIERLEIMAQMHSFLVENAKSELNYVDQNLHQENLLSIFNKIASSLEDGSDLFSEKESFVFLKELAKENTEETEEELEDLVNENSTNLDVRNFISLSSNLVPNEPSSLSEEVIHGNKDFDIDNLISDLD
ncbi:36100_t:CDS:2 [Racocetra persica]|uniref:36100_t:CDS:1 n=1 Tax=Racocetra persica TaxID=160502 RepID=A0ACA9PT62_9GLOM|nr:36100_t:CDS:2 [Racocetra persica]